MGKKRRTVRNYSIAFFLVRKLFGKVGNRGGAWGTQHRRIRGSRVKGMKRANLTSVRRARRS